jgi:hypothetical protein
MLLRRRIEPPRLLRETIVSGAYFPSVIVKRPVGFAGANTVLLVKNFAAWRANVVRWPLEQGGVR